MEPQRRGTRATVIEESNRARFGVSSILRVGDIEDAAVWLLFIIADQKRPCGRGIVGGLAVKCHVMVRDGTLFRRNILLIFLGVVLFRLALRRFVRFLFLCECDDLRAKE